MRPLPAPSKRFSGNPGTTGAKTTAPTSRPPCPFIVNNLELQVACEKLEKKLAEAGASPQERFTAWANALQRSLLARPSLKCVDWLVELDRLGQAGSNESDACITIPCVDLDALTSICEHLAPMLASPPINIAVESYRVSYREGMARLVGILNRPSLCVRTLHLYGQALSVDAVKLLSDALQHKRSLRSLRLMHGTLTDETMVQFAQALKRMHFVEDLDLSNNSCGSVGLGAVAEALAGNPALRKLRINSLGAAGGLAAIFDSLKEVGIEEIHLESASYSEADAKALGRMLASTKTLKVLKLEHPSLGEVRKDRAPALTCKKQHLIFDGLWQNSTLAKLDIRGWSLDKRQVKALCGALVSPQCRLRTLYMYFPEGSPAQRDQLNNAVLRNETLVKLTGGLPREPWVDKHLKRNLVRQAEASELMPSLKNDRALKAALENVEDASLSPQQRFAAWSEALQISLRDNRQDGLDWLALQHEKGANCSFERDACVALSRLTPIQLETAFDWLQRTGISLPVSLKLSGRNIGNTGMNQVSTVLRRGAGLIRSLCITDFGNSLSDEAAECLLNGLRGNQSLQSLTLVKCRHGLLLGKLGDALKDNRSIEALDVSDCSWNAAGLACLAYAIEGNRRLRTLNLAGIQSADGGLEKIFKSLKHSAIEEICLSSAALFPTDAKALGALLTWTKTLSVLKLSTPCWREPSAAEWNPVMRRLKKVPSITAVQRKVTDLIFSGISGNTSLMTLDIQRWELFERHVNSLVAALKHPDCRLHSIDMDRLPRKDLRALMQPAFDNNKTLTRCEAPGNDLIKIIKRNRLLLPAMTPDNLEKVFEPGELPPLPHDVRQLIAGHLNWSEQENVRQAKELILAKK